MPCFTRQEKTVLLMVTAVLLTGSVLQFVFKCHPTWGELLSLSDSSALYQKINVNTATEGQLIDIPYIGAYTAQKIVEYRQEHGGIHDLGELKNIQGIREKNFKRFVVFLKVGKK